MNTRTVRVLAEDVAFVNDLCGLHEATPFAAKLHALLRRNWKDDKDILRLLMREELERFAGGAN